MSDLPSPAWHRQQMEDLEHRTGVQVRAHEIEFPGGHRFHTVGTEITHYGELGHPNGPNRSGYISDIGVSAGIPNENGPTMHRVIALTNRAEHPPSGGDTGGLEEGKVEQSFPTYAHRSPGIHGIVSPHYNYGWRSDIMHHEQFGEALREHLGNTEQMIRDMPEKRRKFYADSAVSNLKLATRNLGFIKFRNFETGGSSLFDPRTGEVKHHQD